MPQQVRLHGGLAFHSAFAFESAIRYTKKKAHGTRHLASQISYWTDVETIIRSSDYPINESRLINPITIDHPLLVELKQTLIHSIKNHGHSIEKVQLFKRYKRFYITFHSLVYGKVIKSVSYIISYSSDEMLTEETTKYGDCIVFYSCDEEHFVLVRTYTQAPESARLSSLVDLPRCDNNRIQNALDRTFSTQVLSNVFDIIPVKWIRHKCVSVPVDSYVCLTEIRVDFEQD